MRTAYIEADGVALEDPDPANKNQRKFAWMTVHEYSTRRISRSHIRLKTSRLLNVKDE